MKIENIQHYLHSHAINRANPAVVASMVDQMSTVNTDNVLVATLTRDEEDDSVYYCNRTNAEIAKALNDGVIVVVSYEGRIYYCTQASNNLAVFRGVHVVNSNTINLFDITFNLRSDLVDISTDTTPYHQ